MVGKVQEGKRTPPHSLGSFLVYDTGLIFMFTLSSVQAIIISGLFGDRLKINSSVFVGGYVLLHVFKFGGYFVYWFVVS